MVSVASKVGVITDEELTSLALAADPDVEVPDDAVPLWDLTGAAESLLPEWYMPPARARCPRLTGWRRRVAITLIIAFLLIDAAGLCSTYGFVVVA
jgi:hypothetical protein